MTETKHSVKRIRERMGINKKSTQKIAENALVHGIGQTDVKYGSLSKYLCSLYCTNKTANNIKIYNQYVYIFIDEILITVYRLPNIYIEQAAKIQKRKAQA